MEAAVLIGVLEYTLYGTELTSGWFSPSPRHDCSIGAKKLPRGAARPPSVSALVASCPPSHGVPFETCLEVQVYEREISHAGRWACNVPRLT